MTEGPQSAVVAGGQPPAAGGRGGPPLDLVVMGGEVVDPASGLRGPYDVGVAGGVIVSLAPHGTRPRAVQVVDARGCLVLPGLVDLHTHIFDGATFWGVDPRPLAWRTGVTTWVDAGSAGAYGARALQAMCGSFGPLRTKAFLHISALGLVSETGESQKEALCDAELCAEVLRRRSGFFAGVKCRLDRFAAGEAALVVLGRAIAAAREAGVPVMVHIGAGPPELDEVLHMLRPGDIVTHCTTGQSMTLVGPSGKLRPSVLEARERGVLFDVGHGSGGFCFAVAETMLAAGFRPDVISSDAHQRSVWGPGFDLPTVMSKFLALGMSLEEVVKAATTSPARACGEPEAGSLGVGKRADIAVFELLEGDFALFDAYLDARKADVLLANRATIAGGTLLGPLPASPPEPWVKVTAQQQALLGKRPEQLRRPWAALLAEPECYVPLQLEGPPAALLGTTGRRRQ